MNEDQIKLQFQRLKRHYLSCVKKIDEISLLDLSHTLRIWTEMAKDIDILLKKKNAHPKFPNTVNNTNVKKVLQGTSFISVPLSSTPATNTGIQIKGFHFIKKALTDEEIKKMFEAGPPQIKNTTLSFEQWINSEIIETKNYKRERIGITRCMLIKRVANILGASHPQEKDNKEDYENHFDPFIKELHSFKVASGYPLTYYQLLEIAQTITEIFEDTFGKN